MGVAPETSVMLLRIPKSGLRNTRSRGGLVPALLMLALTLGGCGAAHHSAATQQPPLTVTMQRIVFRSPALNASSPIPAHYICSHNIWLPLQWGALPSNTEELVLYTGGFGSPRNIAVGAKFTPLIAASLIIGLSPKLTGLPVGELPADTLRLVQTHVPVCPPRTGGREFVFKLFALSREQSISKSSLKYESPFRLLKRLYNEALAEGEFTTRYGS